jgi:2-amino-4-hydroxy-6-hydroxymethyldihydropteridine diphosphokinase
MAAMPTIAFLGIGSNLQSPKDQVGSAIAAIEAMEATHLERRSSLYSSPPMGPPDQPDYINAVVKITTFLTGLELLDRLQRIERDHGRVRGGIRWGPRALDLDILLFGDETIACDRLEVPHPGLAQRAFVVMPLAEIAPELTLPNGVSVAELARGMGDATLIRVPN